MRVDIVFRLENNSCTRESFIKLTADLPIEQKTYSRNPCRIYPFYEQIQFQGTTLTQLKG